MVAKTFRQCTMNCSRTPNTPEQANCEDCVDTAYPDFVLCREIAEVTLAGHVNVAMPKSQAFDLSNHPKVQLSAKNVDLPKGTRVRITIEVINE